MTYVPWTSVPYASSLFTSEDGEEWVVSASNLVSYRYTLNDKLLTVQLAIVGSLIAPIGGPSGVTTLRVQLPESFHARFPAGQLGVVIGSCVWANETGAIGGANPMTEVGSVSTFPETNKLILNRADGKSAPLGYFGASPSFHLAFTAQVEIL